MTLAFPLYCQGCELDLTDELEYGFDVQCPDCLMVLCPDCMEDHECEIGTQEEEIMNGPTETN